MNRRRAFGVVLAVGLGGCDGGSSGGADVASVGDGLGTVDVVAAGDAADASDASGTSDAADPYAAWPDPTTVFPWVAAPDPNKPPYADARWETEDWGLEDPIVLDYFEKLQKHYTTASPDLVAHFTQAGGEIPPLGGGIVLSFSGDILYLGGNWSDFAKGAEPVTRADLRIGNLETAVSALKPPGKGGVPIRFNAPPELLDNLPFDLLQLNNNHTLDADDDGALSTKEQAEARGYRTTGLNGHATLDVKGKQVAVLSYTWGVNRRDYETAQDLFVVPFGHKGEVDLSRIEAEVGEARAGADYVVVLLHWGYEFEWYPDPRFLQMARQMVSFGADVIAAQGPHVVQPAELCWVNHPEKVPGIGTCSVRSADGRKRRAAVLYSLGNFTNDVPDRIEVETGVIGKVSLDGDVTGLGWTPVVLRHDPPRVEPADANVDDPEVAAELKRLDEHLGAGWRLPVE